MTNADLPHIVSAGEALTDLVRTGEHTWAAHPGGAGWNVARAAAALGVPSAFAGAVGRDVFGEEIVRVSRGAGLDMRFLQTFGAPTLLAVVHSVNPPAYFFLGENSADLKFDPRTLPEGWLGAARWLHFGGISLARPPLNEALLGIAERGKARGVKISFDPNARIVHRDPEYRPVFERMLALADLIKLSDEDIRFFFPELGEEEAVAFVRGLNSGAPIVVTRGGEGATLYEGDVRTDFPAVKIQVADTVGAGDAFVAGLLSGAVNHPAQAWPDHLRFALRVAAAACAYPGSHAPTLAEVEALPTG